MVGLLLLLGLFWYWASTLIGDDDNDPGNITPTVAIVIDSTETATATATVSTGITATEGTGQNVGETPTVGADEETPTEEATEDTGEPISTAFEIDDTVTTSDSVNMRTDPDATAENVIVLLEADTELTIAGGPEEGPNADGEPIVWWEVTTADGDTGWVAELYLKAS